MPLFADPIDWDRTTTYEPLTIVYYQGNSYTSRQSVPAGVDITNTTYWALTGNYNAQVEDLKTQLSRYDDRITAANKGTELLSHMGITSEETADDFVNNIDNIDNHVLANSSILGVYNSETVAKAETHKSAVGNVMFYGADNTGKTDVSKIINDMDQEQSISCIYFPNGIYRIDSTLTITKQLMMAPAAIIKAGATMDVMIETTDGYDPYNSPYPIREMSGGIIDGNNLARVCVQSGYRSIHDMRLANATEMLFDVSSAHAAFIHDIFLEGARKNVVGMKTSYDCTYSNILIWDCGRAIVNTGFNSFDNIYIWGGNQQTYETVGIEYGNSRLMIGYIYFDCLQYAIKPQDGTKTLDAKINNLYVYTNSGDVPMSINQAIFHFNGKERISVNNAMWEPGRDQSFNDTDYYPLELHWPPFSESSDRQKQYDAIFSSHNSGMTTMQRVTKGAINLSANKAIKLLECRSGQGATINVRSTWGDFRAQYYVNKYDIVQQGTYVGVIDTYLVKKDYGLELWLKNSSTKDKNQIQFCVSMNCFFTTDIDVRCFSMQNVVDLPDGAIKVNN